MGAQNHFERTRALISRQTGVPEAEITPETRLAEDLGVAGDDGAELLQAFGNEFGADVSAAAAVTYFGDETPFASGGNNVFIPLLALISPRFAAFARNAVRGRRTVRVRDLVASARAGRWLRPPVIPAENDPTAFGIRFWLQVAGTFVIAALFGLWRYAVTELAPIVSLRAGLIALGVIWLLLLIRCLISLRMLKRLDAAATHEEEAGLT